MGEMAIEIRMPNAEKIREFEAIYLRELNRKMDKFVRQGQKKFDRTTRTWKSKPRWEIKEALVRDGRGLSLEKILETDSAPFVFVALGTSKRHAIFSQDYRPKTKIGSLTSRGGAGRVVVRGRKAARIQGARRRKIEGRMFHEIIALEQKNDFKAGIQAVSERHAKRFRLPSEVVGKIVLIRSL